MSATPARAGLPRTSSDTSLRRASRSPAAGGMLLAYVPNACYGPRERGSHVHPAARRPCPTPSPGALAGTGVPRPYRPRPGLRGPVDTLGDVQHRPRLGRGHPPALRRPSGPGHRPDLRDLAERHARRRRHVHPLRQRLRGVRDRLLAGAGRGGTRPGDPGLPGVDRPTQGLVRRTGKSGTSGRSGKGVGRFAGRLSSGAGGIPRGPDRG